MPRGFNERCNPPADHGTEGLGGIQPASQRLQSDPHDHQELREGLPTSSCTVASLIIQRLKSELHCIPAEKSVTLATAHTCAHTLTRHQWEVLYKHEPDSRLTAYFGSPVHLPSDNPPLISQSYTLGCFLVHYKSVI